MTPMRQIWVLAMLLPLFALWSCGEHQINKTRVDIEPKEQIRRTLPIQNYSLIDLSELEGFKNHHMAEALQAFGKSCEVVGKSGYSLSNFGFFIKDIPSGVMQASCEALEGLDFYNQKAVLAYFQSHFSTFRIGKSNQGLLTGYYQSTINASRTKDSIYRFPIHGIPTNLVKVEMNAFGRGLPPKTINGRLVNGKLTPYFTRGEILRGIMATHAQPLLWADNPIDVYILHIQGSGKAILNTGEQVNLSYAGNNGHSYRSVIRSLMNDGSLKKSQASWQGLQKYLQEQKDSNGDLLSINPRYIFFEESSQSTSKGALGVPLTPERSIAVDPDHIPLGVPIWLESSEIGNSLVIAQDTGNAIRGRVRADFFWGSGKDARKKAEKTYYKIGMIVFLPKPLGNIITQNIPYEEKP